jgi:uncharacterized caspase-like protein
MTKRSAPEKFHCLIIACALLLALALSLDAAAAKEARTWAVVVGIDEYLKEVSPLNCAVNDAENFKKAIMEKAGLAESNIFLLTTRSKSGNRVPDKSNIIRWVSYVKSNAGPDDTFIFFFSGHGMDMDKETYLLTYEADPESKETLEMSSLRVTDLRKLINEMPVSKVLLFVDACRNDPRSGKGAADNKMTDIRAKSLVITGRNSVQKGRSGASFALTFFSCKVGERSYEWTEQGMGFFTYHLVKGMNGAAADESGNVTLGSIRDYIAKTVPQTVQKERGKISMSPWVKGDASADSDEWVFCRGAEAHRAPRKETPIVQATHNDEKPLKDDTLEPYPQSPDRNQAGIHRDRGDDYVMRKKYDQAIGEYREALRWDPGYLAVYESLGETYTKAADFNGATGAYSRALAIKPDSADFFLKRGIAYGKRGDFEKALKDVNKALEINPKYASAYFQRGSICETLKRTSEALDAYRKCIEIAPPSEEELKEKARARILKIERNK